MDHATQYCPRCASDVPLKDYHPGKRGKPGTYCRPCCKDYMRTYTDPDAFAARAPRSISTTYRAAHQRVVRQRGPATAQWCEHCGYRGRPLGIRPQRPERHVRRGQVWVR